MMTENNSNTTINNTIENNSDKIINRNKIIDRNINRILELVKNKNLKTPFFAIDKDILKANLEILKMVEERSGCHILLAQKCFSSYETYDFISQYVSGTTASGLYEAKLGKLMNKENHVYCPGYKEDDMKEIISLCDHIVFNSFSQWQRYKDDILKNNISAGLRINPEFSTHKGNEMYDPCGKYSRMGITLKEFEKGYENGEFKGIEGLHFHTLCEQNSIDLKNTLDRVCEKFGKYFKEIKWINFGGGHHITKEDYDIDILIDCISKMKNEYGLEVYLEPGEAFAINAGYLVSSVVDIIKNDINIAILDTSAACHMPDVLEVPYVPEVFGASIVDDISEFVPNVNCADYADNVNYEEHANCADCADNADNANESVESDDNEAMNIYRFGGMTCLSGDVIGDYALKNPLKYGDLIVFKDMAIYSMVKTNTFNGMKLPDIYLFEDNDLLNLRTFGYEDFKSRL